MPKEEIISGLRAAVERGESLEQAKQSFINAGYDSEEVEQAAGSLEGTMTKYPQLPQQLPSQQPSQQPQLQQIPSPQPRTKQIKPLPTQLKKPEKKGKKGIFILIILVILLILLALFFIFRDKILSFIADLF